MIPITIPQNYSPAFCSLIRGKAHNPIMTSLQFEKSVNPTPQPTHDIPQSSYPTPPALSLQPHQNKRIKSKTPVSAYQIKALTNRNKRKSPPFSSKRAHFAQRIAVAG